MVVLMSNLPIDSALSDSSSAVEEITAIRQQSNQAIARHDAAGVVAALDTPYQVTSGVGALFQENPEQELAHWQEIFSTSEDIIYTRTPEKIEVSTYLPRAAENGSWVGSWTTANGPKELGGSYFASWSKVDGEWKIRSEIFVTLFCTGPGC
jgi:ketosteroid isomerase-like protein